MWRPRTPPASTASRLEELRDQRLKENAGGTWVDEGLVTSRTLKDLPGLCAKIVEGFAEVRHPEQARSS